MFRKGFLRQTECDAPDSSSSSASSSGSSSSSLRLTPMSATVASMFVSMFVSSFLFMATSQFAAALTPPSSFQPFFQHQGLKHTGTLISPLSSSVFLRPRTTTATTIWNKSLPSSTARYMVFDFFKQRTQEGMQTLNNMANIQGQLFTRNVQDMVEKQTKFFNQGLANSRTQLVQNLNKLFTSIGLEGLPFFTGSDDDSLEEWLDNLQNVLLQADLGMSTAEDVLEEVKSYILMPPPRSSESEDKSSSSSPSETTKRTSLTQDDLLSILRGKLIEALDMGEAHRIVFARRDNYDIHVDDAGCDNDKGQEEYAPDNYVESKLPTVLFIMGANGMGKTTTIGKLAHRLRTEGNQKVLLAACDTFRAGAVAQLAQWADRAQVEICMPAIDPNSIMSSPSTNQDTASPIASSSSSSAAAAAIAVSPSSVLYTALDKAMAESFDVILVDTSGRLSNNEPLTAELAKMKRVIQKRLSVAKDPETNRPIPNLQVPHETLLVMDAAQGRMALDAAKTWHRDIGLTGLILTKLDGTARGGSVVAVSRELKLPVKLIGVGEGIDDLRDFEPDRFVDGLLGIGQVGGSISSAKDGSALAMRLVEMRKERDKRAFTSAAASQSKIRQMPLAASAGGTHQAIQKEAGVGNGNNMTGKSNKSSGSIRSKKAKKGKK